MYRRFDSTLPASSLLAFADTLATAERLSVTGEHGQQQKDDGYGLSEALQSTRHESAARPWSAVVVVLDRYGVVVYEGMN